MKKPVHVFVQSSQQYDDYADQISTNSKGEYSSARNVHTITYTEKLEGDNIVNNTLVLKKEGVELHRSGGVTSQMFFMQGKTTDTEYLTSYGAVNFQVITLKYNAVIEEDDINVVVQYDLIHNGQKVSRNLLQVSIKILQEK